MRKSFATDDQPNVIEAAGGQAFQFFFDDDKMTKMASDVVTREDIQAHKPPSNMFGVHLISMGAEETYGENRNGDSFSIDSLKSHHPSFEKFAHVYREHKNRDPHTQGIGIVKLARYNPDMQRGELIIHVDKDKAPDMFKKAKAGKELSFSMACRLPYDQCSVCDNKAKTQAKYCGHLKNKLTQYVPEFQKYAYSRNEKDVKFFDISEVGRRADRIATYLGYSFNDDDLLSKAASETTVIGGAAWAEHQLGLEVAEFTPWEDMTLEKLAAAAEFYKHASPEIQENLDKMTPSPLGKDAVDTLANTDFRSVAGELCKKSMLLDFPTFASLVTSKSNEELSKEAGFASILEDLPELLKKIVGQQGCGCGQEAADAVAPDSCGTSFSPDKDSIDKLMRDVGGELGMSPEESQGRAIHVTIVKKASVVEPQQSEFFNTLAEAYGYYFVKSAHEIKSNPRINETAFLRIAAATLFAGNRAN